METQDIVPSCSIPNLLAQRDAIVGRMQKAADLFHEIEQVADASFSQARACRPVPSLRDTGLNASFPGSLDVFIKCVDAAAWDHLLNASGLRTFMDTAARKKWDEGIAQRKVAPLTDENIRATFRELHASRGAMFENGVLAVYKSLSWDYKTNSPRHFGKRIIVTYLVDVWGTSGRRYVSGARYENCNKLDDLIRVLLLLDGKPEPDHRQGAYNLLRAVNWPTDQQVVELAVRSIRQYIASGSIITPGSSPWREAAKRYLPLLINGEYGVLLSKFLIIGEGMRPKSEPGGVVIHGELIILAREMGQLCTDISLPPWIILLLEPPIV